MYILFSLKKHFLRFDEDLSGSASLCICVYAVLHDPLATKFPAYLSANEPGLTTGLRAKEHWCDRYPFLSAGAGRGWLVRTLVHQTEPKGGPPSEIWAPPLHLGKALITGSAQCLRSKLTHAAAQRLARAETAKVATLHSGRRKACAHRRRVVIRPPQVARKSPNRFSWLALRGHAPQFPHLHT